MSKVGIITNPKRDNNYEYTDIAEEFLRGRGVATVRQDAGMTGGFGGSADSAGNANSADSGVSAHSAENADSGGSAIAGSLFAVVLGGDGTMLRAAGAAARNNVPMLGINLGTLGYLTDVDKEEGLAAIQKALDGQCRYERRMMLDVCGRLALNELHIYSAGARLGTFRIEVNGAWMDTLRADGIIVATPTGSTAYNLSAGGPILVPDSQMTVITPICPHALYTRPWVLRAEDTVTVTAPDSGIRWAVDGSDAAELAPGQSLTVTKADCFLQIIRTSGMDFFEILRKKLVES